MEGVKSWGRDMLGDLAKRGGSVGEGEDVKGLEKKRPEEEKGFPALFLTHKNLWAKL